MPCINIKSQSRYTLQYGGIISFDIVKLLNEIIFEDGKKITTYEIPGITKPN